MAFAIKYHGSTPPFLASTCSEFDMERSYEAFNPGLGVYGLRENDSMAGASFENFLLPPYNAAETSWYSSSSEDYSMEAFGQLENYQSVSSLETLSLMSANVGCGGNRKSAFGSYVGVKSNVGANFAGGGQILMKRCFRLLRRIDEKTKLTNQIQLQGARCQSQETRDGVPTKSAFQHMIAERNRRIKLRQHFSVLYSLLPRNSKKDKYSVLLNATKYLTELRLRVDELEQKNQALEDSIHANIPENLPEQQKISAGKFLYHNDEVDLEQTRDLPCEVKIKIKIHIKIKQCSTSLLINLLERLRKEEVDLLSVASHSDAFCFRVDILVRPKGDGWEASTWQRFGDVVRDSIGR